MRQGAAAHGFTGDVWTLRRIAVVVARLTGVRYHLGHLWAVLHQRLGWSVQRPVRRAAERNQQAIRQWVEQDWPRIKQTPAGAKPEQSSSTSLSPVEQVWSNLKGNELANLAAQGLGEVIAAAWQGIERIRAAWHLPYSFLRHCGLSVS